MKRLLFVSLMLLTSVVYGDSTTSRFGLIKPDIGSTNWGPKLNTNSDLIDDAAGQSKTNTFSNTNVFTGLNTYTSTNTFISQVDFLSSSKVTISTNVSVSGGLTVTSTATFSGPSTFSSNVSVSTNVTVTGTAIFTGNTRIAGTTTNDDAFTGDVGESTRAFKSNLVVSSSNTFFDICTLNLTAGDWDATSMLGQAAVGGVTVTLLQSAITVTPGNVTTGMVFPDNQVESAGASTTVGAVQTISNYRLSLSTTTRIYLKVLSNFSGGNTSIYARLSARRRR